MAENKPRCKIFSPRKLRELHNNQVMPCCSSDQSLMPCTGLHQRLKTYSTLSTTIPKHKTPLRKDYFTCIFWCLPHKLTVSRPFTPRSQAVLVFTTCQALHWSRCTSTSLESLGTSIRANLSENWWALLQWHLQCEDPCLSLCQPPIEAGCSTINPLVKWEPFIRATERAQERNLVTILHPFLTETLPALHKHSRLKNKQLPVNFHSINKSILQSVIT